MAQQGVFNRVARLTALGIRGKALGLAGLDLTLRPASRAGLALRRLLAGGGHTELSQTRAGPAGRLMSDAQRVIDELNTLRADSVKSDSSVEPDNRHSLLATQMPDDSPDQGFDHALAVAGTAAFTAPAMINDDAVHDQADDLLALEQQLRRAIKREEFELYYQPVVDLDANRPLGAEALIRWHSPDRGFVSPGMFLPLAEASGLIDPIGLWVLREACREAAGWDPALRVAINLGARQFLDQNLTWHVTEAIDAAGIRPDQLEIELTESVAMVDSHHTKATFTALRDLGLHIAIDDFGADPANLSTLLRLPFTRLKIDREFVADVHLQPGSLAICEALIVLGARLGLEVVAEGTEMAEEVALLNQRGCSLFQGYYFARPVPAPVLAATFDNLWLREAAKTAGAA